MNALQDAKARIQAVKNRLNEPKQRIADMKGLVASTTESQEIITDLNGFYYDIEGNYLGNYGESKIVFISKKIIKKNIEVSENNKFTTKTKITTEDTPTTLSIEHDKFISNSSAVYGESSIAYNIFDLKEIYAIASVHKINKIAYGINSPYAINFRSKKNEERNLDIKMRTCIKATINSIQNGIDYSNGAIGWDGAEQGFISGNSCSEGNFQSHAACIGWTIHNNHYNSWKLALNNKFPKKVFVAPQHKAALKCEAFKNKKTGAYYNYDYYRYESVAQYALTIFWKDRGINNESKNPVTD